MDQSKKIVITYEGLDYLWNKNIWSRNNLSISTSLTQKLSLLAIKLGLMSKEDFMYDHPKENEESDFDDSEEIEAKPASQEYEGRDEDNL